MEPANRGLKTQEPWVQIKLPWIVFSDNLSQQSLTETCCSKYLKYLISCFLKIKSSSKIGDSSQYFTKQEMEMHELKHCQENSASKIWSQMYHWGLPDVQPYNPADFPYLPTNSQPSPKYHICFCCLFCLVSVNWGGISRFRGDSIVFKGLLESFFKCSLYNKYIVFGGANGNHGRRVKN